MSAPDAPANSRQTVVGRKARKRTLAAAVLLAASAAFAAYRLSQPSHEEVVALARSSFAAQDYDSALAHARRGLSTDPASIDALLIAGGSCAELKEFEDAFWYYERLPDGDDRRLLDGRAVAAHLLLFQLGRASEAEARYRGILARDPRHPAAVAGMANLLGLTGRRREAAPLLIELIRQNRITVNQLTLLGSESGGFSDPDLHRRCLKAVPDDPLPMMGLAWQASHDGKLLEAERWTRRALEAAPHSLAAHVGLGRSLLEQNRLAAFHCGSSALPDGADDHPEVWLIRGESMRHREQLPAAARCYGEAIRRDPNLRVAIHQLAQILLSEENSEQAEPFLSRLRKLQRLTEFQSFLFESQHRSLAPIRNVAEQMERLGRLWESYAWSRFAQKLDARAEWPQHRCARLEPRLVGDRELTLPNANPARQLDLSERPLPNWSSERPGSDSSGGAAGSQSTVRFVESAAAAGIEFRYYNSADHETPGQKMYEFSGGGVGAIDYDLDGWPDLYLTQGCRRPDDPADESRLDRLFRNRAGERFEDVTRSARLVENGFSQGVAAGDFNSDGMPDLYVANIGRNALYVNNGDGTFSDVSSAIGFDEERWTTSCLLADLDGDGLADIYDANYLSGEDVFKRVCQHKDGKPRMCAPFDFPAASDQFYRNGGDGQFRDSTAAAGFDVENGKGLGLVAADFDGSGQLGLYVANDLVANFYFRRESGTSGGSARFVEEGMQRGLAFDAGGRAQGSMGIAIADANADDRLDLFITNFAQEHYAFYFQQPGGMFRDAIAQSGLAPATLPVLGFGTQFLDGELDGLPDLVVTNGQVDDHRAYGRAWKMKPQYFRNLGRGTFIELDGESLGPFFQGEYLGRGMARLDWNRDGREDVAISHLEAPAALLTNSTTAAGHFLSIRLVARRSHRDAIGATVRVQLGDVRRMQQLTAGDGYQASNQRQLVFGLGESATVDAIEIDWPSGERQRLELLPADGELLIVEGVPQPFPLPR